MKQKRIAVAMSGGVDSSVAAWKLQQAGYEVIGLSLKLYDNPSGDPLGQSCCSPRELSAARRVAGQLGIRFYVVEAKEMFQRQVIEPFTATYLAGRTPSPCLLCNQHLKFDWLLQRAQALEAEALATGHYAIVRQEKESGLWQLWRSPNRQKDQSYFLARLNQRQLARASFPIGDLEKGEVRRLAREAKLVVSEKKESQEVCFLGAGGVADFLRPHLPPAEGEGEIIHVRAGAVGRHRGVYPFTVGQRQGLQVAWSQPLYVVAVDPARARLYVGEAADLLTRSFRVTSLHWISGHFPEAAEGLTVRIRSRSVEYPCSLRPEGKGEAEVALGEAARAVAPGQAAVFSRGDQILGSGWIESWKAEQPWPMYR